MLTAEDNDLVCRVGPGTPMGELMRRHWVPALRSSELVADGEPVRLMLLGEKLVAFRDTSGKVGIMDHECPHRLASLFYGRNEEGGLRCIYHGWKFDTEGNCLEMANVPPHQDFKDKVKAVAYQVQERSGLIWAYMGQGKAPALPTILANMLPTEELNIGGFLRESNWLQALEGDIDTSHANFLHGGMNGVVGLKRTAIEGEDDPARYDPLRYGYTDTPYEFEGAETPWGTMYGAHRQVDASRDYWRLAQFIFPFWTITPTSPIAERVRVRAWVPMDDTHTMSYSIGVKSERANRSNAVPDPAPAIEDPYLPNTTDWYGRWRLSQHARNDYKIDRELQRTVSYSGIRGGATPQDQLVTESMGAIENRTKEHLAPTDRMIQITRRRLIDAAKQLRDTGIAPETATRPAVYGEVTGGYFLTQKGKDLGAVYKEQFDAWHANHKAQLAAE